MDVFEAINKRRSVRNYLSDDISEEELNKIIETGKIAPKAGVIQISVIKNKEILDKIAETATEALKNSGKPEFEKLASTPGFTPTHGAPILIVFSANAEDPFGAVNGSLAAENIILAATDLGLGTCYMLSPTFAFNTPKKEELFKDIGLSDGFVPVGAVALGKIGPNHVNPPRESNDIVNYID